MPIGILINKDIPFKSLQIELDGVVYTLQLRWNERAAGWFMNILDEEGLEVIRAGIRVVVNYPLNFHTASRRPAGILIAFDASGSNLDPGETELGDGARVQLVYFTAAETT